MRNNRRGVTLVELMIAMVGASFVIWSAITAYTTFIKRSVQQQKNSMLQQEMASAGQMIEKDIRMAGYALPGTGVRVDMTGQVLDTIHFFTNEQSHQTVLVSDAPASEGSIIVADISGVSAGQWVCIDNDSVLVYRRISGFSAGVGEYKVGLSGGLPGGIYYADKDSTTVYYASRASYYLDQTVSPAKFVRHKNSRISAISSEVTQLYANVTNANDSTLTSMYDSARVVMLVFEGGGTSSGASVRRDTISAAIRNYQ